MGTKNKNEVPMRKMRFENTQDCIQEIEQALKSNPEGRYSRRLHFVLLLLKGFTTYQAAELFNGNPRTVKHWGQQYQRKGLAGLKEAERPGRPRKLSLENLAKIQQDLRKPTSDFGYQQGFWDGPLLKHHLEKHYNVDITVRHCQRVFHYLELSLKYPRPKMAGASAEAQEAFKKN
jgi:transposase